MTDTSYVESKELLRERGEQSQGSNFKERRKYGKSSQGRDVGLACENRADGRLNWLFEWTGLYRCDRKSNVETV
jgi:hypothetical protein